MQPGNQIGSLAAILRFDGRGEFVLPFFAQRRLDVIVTLQRRARGECPFDPGFGLGQPGHQSSQQTVAAKQALLFTRRSFAEGGQPGDLLFVESGPRPAGKTQSQAAREGRVRNALEFGGQQDQDRARRRFLECFEKRV